MKASTKKKASIIVFLCALIYFISYLTRKSFSTIIIAISSGTGILETELGVVITVNFIAYGIGQLISGFLGDKIQPKKLVALGLITTVLMNLAIPFTKSHVLMAVLWSINGFAQAFMWPPIVKILMSELSEVEYKKNIQKVLWASSFATVFLYLVCPLILHLFDWTFVFYFAAFGGLVGLIYWCYVCPEIELVKKVQKAEKTEKKKIPFAFVFIPIMLAIILQGALRDGVTDWMPSFVQSIFNLPEESSILSGVFLPFFSMFSYAITTWLYTRKFKNPLACSAFVFAIGMVSAVILWLFPSSSLILSITMSTILTVCMHGVNFLLICLLPGYFKRTGKVSLISGILNCCTYIGSALATYVIPMIAAGEGGWNLNLFTWVIITIVGCLVCVLSIPKWKKYEERLIREYPEEG